MNFSSVLLVGIPALAGVFSVAFQDVIPPGLIPEGAPWWSAMLLGVGWLLARLVGQILEWWSVESEKAHERKMQLEQLRLEHDGKVAAERAAEIANMRATNQEIFGVLRELNGNIARLSAEIGK